MKNFISYFKHEIISKLFSSKKKIIKLIAISLVPFLYGFICIWAFWNPVPNIGKVPMAIVDTSQRIDMAIGIDNNKKMVVGEVESKDGNIVSIKNPNDPNTPITLTNCLVYKQNYSFIESFINGWADTKVKDSLIYKNDNGSYSINISETSPLNNVSYFNDKTNIKAKDVAVYNKEYNNPISKEKGGWEVKNEDYWLQIQIPSQFNTIFAKTLTDIYLNASQPGVSFEWTKSLMDLKKEPINIWTTFKKNFLFGQFMKVFQEFKSSLYIDFFPRLLVQTLTNIIVSMTNDIATNYHDQLFFTPTSDINTTITTSFHNGTKGSKTSKVENLAINLKANEKVLFRNNELRNAFYNAVLSDPSVNQEDKNKLKNLYTYEGDTTNLIDAGNDWVHNVDDLSFIGLNLSLIKPIVNAIMPPSNQNFNVDNISQYKLSLSKYLTNKMFLTSLLEKDAKSFPNKPIDNIINDKIVESLVNTIPKNDVVFSNNDKNMDMLNQPLSVNKIVTTEKEWNVYIEKLSIIVKDIFNALKKPNNAMANAPPANNSLEGIVTSGVIGHEFSPYGIGLGQFFLFIGVWVGILMQTFMLDRKRRGPAFKTLSKSKQNKVTFWSRISESMQWYLSKTLMMLIITFLQVTILSATVAAIGWWEIGPTFGLVYLQLLFSGFIFTLLIQSLWFLFRDEVIGKFIVILLLIVNLSSGWGTFPPQMQFPFFQVLSYIAPFTYQIRNIGAIVYGIGVQGSNIIDNMFILQNIGISLIYLLISILLAFIGSMKLTKMQYYGTYNGIKLAKVIKHLSDENLLNYINNFDINKVLVQKKTLIAKLHLNNIFKKSDIYTTINWNFMPQYYEKLICDNFNQKYPYEEKFKWFKQKFMDKNAQTDEEIDVVI